MEGLAKGRIVHYVLGSESINPGVHRPAIIVNVWSDDGLVNLSVFTDHKNDFHDEGDGRNGLMWATSIKFDDDDKLPGTWHWIERA